MTNPNQWLSDAGLASRGSLSTKGALKVLKHLIEPGEESQLMRVTMRDGKIGISVTNSRSTPGWSIRSKNLQQELFLYEWIEPDEEATQRQGDRSTGRIVGVEIFKISKAGREAVAQHKVHAELRPFVVERIRLLLLRKRKEVGIINT